MLGRYLGAMCDLVGEIGRYAVRKATERDAGEVRAALASAMAVQSAMLSLGSAAPRGLHKKGDALRTAVRRLTLSWVESDYWRGGVNSYCHDTDQLGRVARSLKSEITSILYPPSFPLLSFA